MKSKLRSRVGWKPTYLTGITFLFATKRLGFYIGPKSGAENWHGPITKFRERVKAIKTSQAGISLASYSYNIRTIPVTSYQAQLLHLPRELALLERVALHAVLRLPFNTFRHGDFFQLHMFGGPKFRSLTAACAAAIFRTAQQTITTWPVWVAQLNAAAEQFLALDPLARGRRSPAIWDSQPIALNLKQAFDGFQNDPRWARPTSAFIRELTADNQGIRPPPGATCLYQLDSGIQKAIYSKLVECHFSVNLIDHLMQRIRILFPREFSLHVHAVNLQAAAFIKTI